MKQLSIIAGLMLVASCANSSPPPPNTPQTTVRMDAPLRVTWEELSRGPTQAVVVAKVERLNGLDMSFLMEIELPPGVKASQGRTRITLAPNSEPDLTSERLTLVFEGEPQGDAVLKLDGDTGAMGFHFKVPYRFGRPAPEPPGPAATGPELRKGDKAFGPSVPLK